MHKIYTNRINHDFMYAAKMAADYTNTPIQYVLVDEAMAADDAFKAKKAHGKFPIMETPKGEMVYESLAIASYIARHAKCTDLYGKTAFEEAQVEQWMSIASAAMWPCVFKVAMVAFGWNYDLDKFNEGCKDLKEQCKMINTHLGGNKQWLACDRLTLADLSLFAPLAMGFSTVLDAGFRKAMPHLTAWFEKMAKLPIVAKTCGFIRFCDKAVKPVDPTKVQPVGPKPAEAPKKEEKKGGKGKDAKKEEKKPAKKEEDEMDDLFGEDDDEEAAKEAAFEMKAKAQNAKKAADLKAKGKVIIAKSIVIWDVKPFGSETDLTILANKILAIQKDGLVWKTEWKKEPLAFGVFKIQIGAVIEDEKISTDDISEEIENITDPSAIDAEDNEEGYMAQSTEIVVFNKL